MQGKNELENILKLYRSLKKGGYLVLGEAEIPLLKYQMHFQKVADHCHLYHNI